MRDPLMTPIWETYSADISSAEASRDLGRADAELGRVTAEGAADVAWAGSVTSATHTFNTAQAAAGTALVGSLADADKNFLTGLAGELATLDSAYTDSEVALWNAAAAAENTWNMSVATIDHDPRTCLANLTRQSAAFQGAYGNAVAQAG